MIESVTLNNRPCPAPTTRVLLVDDHPLVRTGLAMLIQEESDMEVCAEAADARAAQEAAVSERPDIAVVDWTLGQRDASELICILQQIRPGMPILVLSMHDEVNQAEKVLRLGARGYVMKRDATERVIEAIRRTMNGDYSFTDRALAVLPEDLRTMVGSRLSEGGTGNYIGQRKDSAPSPPGETRGDLVIAPHPDDETFGCGGTIRLVAESGTPIDVVFMTRGELGHEQGSGLSPAESRELADQRTAEAIEACKTLGVRRVSFLEGLDTRLSEQPHLAVDLLTILNDNRYRRVFCPWKHDGHRDHQATFALFQNAVRHYADPLQVWLYEVWTPLGFNMLIPIDRTITHKKKAMQMYRTQLDQLNYRGGFLGLSAYRSTFCPPATFAEAFHMCSKQEMLTL